MSTQETTTTNTNQTQTMWMYVAVIRELLQIMIQRRHNLIEDLADCWARNEFTCQKDFVVWCNQRHEKLNKQMELLFDNSIPLYVREFCIRKDIRHFDCDCGAIFIPEEAYHLHKLDVIGLQRFNFNTGWGRQTLHWDCPACWEA